MESEDRQRITLAIGQLVEKVNMVKLYPKLFEHEIFYEDDPNAPKWKLNLCDPAIKRDILLDIRTRGPDAYQNFLCCLKEIDQPDLIDVLNDQNRSHGEIDLTNNDKSNPLPIEVKKSTSFYDRSDTNLYPMQSRPRGLVLIITLINYSFSGDYRTAADLDEKNLKDLFEQMGFKVFTVGKKDLTVKEMKKEIEEFSQNPQFRYVDSSFVIISGHGNKSSKIEGESVICGVDHPGVDFEYPEKELSYGEILKYFSGKNCRLLQNKPKVFIFQACRGHQKQKTTCYKGNEDSPIPISFKSLNETFPIECNLSSRTYEDMLIVHATLPDHMAFRDITKGSWLHQAICKVFAEKAHNHHLLELFTAVDYHISSMRADEQSCQTVAVKLIGFKNACYINPGHFGDNS